MHLSTLFPIYPKTSSVQHALRAYDYVMWQGVKNEEVNKWTLFLDERTKQGSHYVSTCVVTGFFLKLIN